jgi:hypothetical protein
VIRRRNVLTSAVCTALLLVGPGPCASALADGDPASDVLSSQSVFLPRDAGAPSPQLAQLQQLVSAARRSGYPLRVAVISSRSDLGSVTALWRQPQSYAQFLGQELALAYRGRVLVVMPNGLGLYRAGGTSSAERAALARGRSARSATGLVAAAIDAVRRLAAASGHPLPLAGASLARSGSGDPIGWVVFALGCVAIGLAWGASLRAKPLQLRRRARGA